VNIKITHNWLLDYLDTNATPYEIQKYLSLCGPSVENLQKIGNDYVYDIEITSNRVDAASVFGIAQEAVAILPQFGKKATLKQNPLLKYAFKKTETKDQISFLKINIMEKDLCSRFTAVILTNVEISSSPEFIEERLKLVGIKTINNVIDISNYLMVALGQPTHIFDYNKIGKQMMIMRSSKKGEIIKTLDEKEITLPGNDIVIEDGNGNLIDLCGIMGGLNSSVTNSTTNVVLFIQTYNKQKIRKTSMTTGQRTVAATYFEKGLDEERVEPAIMYGLELLKECANAQVVSEIYDIYPKPYDPKIIKIPVKEIDEKIGVPIGAPKMASILEKLGFSVRKGNELQIIVPSYRQYDIEIKEDIVEEVARVYGYYNLPDNLSPSAFIKQPKEMVSFFMVQDKIKYLLKHLGLHEYINYSMVSKILIESFGGNVIKHLRISNALSSEIEYMRTSLLPSLVKNIKDNEGKKDRLKLFEISKIYLPKQKNLPHEIYKLGIAVNTDFFDLKGIIEGILKELNISDYSNKLIKQKVGIFSDKMSSSLIIGNKNAGLFGKLKQEFQVNFGLKSAVFLAELDLNVLIENYKMVPVFKPLHPYAVIKLDITFELSDTLTYESIKKKAFSNSKLLQNMEMVDIFKNKATIRFYFSSPEKNITEHDAFAELRVIQSSLK
jgi:phenylalanyl-tRNA synthetase beta chain